jgi:hypothetical protein
MVVKVVELVCVVIVAAAAAAAAVILVAMIVRCRVLGRIIGRG